jgi:hypothetical protein
MSTWSTYRFRVFYHIKDGGSKYPSQIDIEVMARSEKDADYRLQFEFKKKVQNGNIYTYKRISLPW